MDKSPKKIVKYLALVPLRFNDGTEVPADIILEFQDTLFEKFGGFTVCGTVEGAYKMANGKKAIDHSAQYWIGIPESEYETLRSIVAELGQKLGQESMFLENTGSTIDFVKPAAVGENS